MLDTIVSFKTAATLLHVAITTKQNDYIFVFVVSAVVYVAPNAITLNTIV